MLPNPTPTPGVDSDAIDHTQDTFWIWLNPKMHYNQSYQGVPNVNMNFLAQQPAIIPYPITVAQLLGKAPDPEGVMSGWTAADKTSLLSQDPFLQPGYKPDSKRYSLVQQVVVRGPVTAGGKINDSAIPISYTGQNCNQTQEATTSTVSIGGNITVGFVVVTSFQAYDTITSTQTWSKSKCDQLSQTLLFSPASSTLLYHHLIDVYMDNLNGTLAYVDLGPDNASSSDSAQISGTIKGINGKSVKFGQVDLLLSNGVRRTMVSDENGHFQTNVPAGSTTIKTGASENKVVLKRGKKVATVLRIIR
jgi:hypothetical protein